jgi:hypothetical protein
VETLPATDITATTATGNGNVISLGIKNPTHHGIVWSKEHNPSVNLSTKTDSGIKSSTGVFTGLMTGLTPDTTYYARAYAYNTSGTGYGKEVGFKTLLAGDIDSNGIVELKDAVIILQILAGINQKPVNIRADVNNDGKIDLRDAVYVIQKVTGIK